MTTSADHPDRGVHELALEVPEAVPAVALRSGDRARRQHHHEPDHGEEAGRAEQQTRSRAGERAGVRSRPAFRGQRAWRAGASRSRLAQRGAGRFRGPWPLSLSHRRPFLQRARGGREAVPALGVVAELVPARARRRQEHDTRPRRERERRGRRPPRSSLRAPPPRACRANAATTSPALSPIATTARSRPAPRRERREVLSLRATAGDQHGVARPRRSRRARRARSWPSSCRRTGRPPTSATVSPAVPRGLERRQARAHGLSASTPKRSAAAAAAAASSR